MRIGIDARFYGPRQKGLGRYVQKLIQGLEKIDFNNQYVVFLRKENWNEYLSSNPNFKKVLADCGWYTFAEQFSMPLKIWQAKVDLMYFPHFNVPLLFFGPFVMTIHDLILKHFPTRRVSTLGPVLYRIKNVGYNLAIYSAVRRARRIIAVSQHTKRDILRHFNINPCKIEVVYEGVTKLKDCQGEPSSVCHPGPDPGSRILDSRFRGNDTLKIPKPYLLYVGNAYPHKNLKRLILAFDKLAGKHPNLRLVLVGELDSFYGRLQRETLGAGNVVFTDFVSDKKLNVLYRNASGYIFPSLCEGFGLPPLEAMAEGVPVASSSASCLPEILGKAAIYFNPESSESIAGAMEQLLGNEELREKLVRRGFRRIRRYSWGKMAENILKIFRNAVSY